MLIHVFSLNNQFLKHTIHLLNSLHISQQHVLWEISSQKNKAEFKNNNHRQIQVIHGSIKELQSFIKENKANLELIIFHGLLKENFRAAWRVRKVGKKVPLGWVIYGAELVHDKVSMDLFLLPHTKRAYFITGFHRILLPPIKIFKRLIGYHLRNLLTHFTYILHFMPEEIEWTCKQLRISHLKPLFFTYVPIEMYLQQTLTLPTLPFKGNILLANSATFTSNHLDFIYSHFDYLQHLDEKIVIPLSYGNKSYASYVVRKLNRCLPQKVLFIKNFIPLDEYQKLLSSCSCAVFNHKRQQGLGNLIIALWAGQRVYLRSETTTFTYLTKRGFIVHAIDKDRFNHMSLTGKEAEINKSLLLKYLSIEQVQKQLFKPI